MHFLFLSQTQLLAYQFLHEIDTDTTFELPKYWNGIALETALLWVLSYTILTCQAKIGQTLVRLVPL